MFFGVYALGVTIIGYQYSAVSHAERALYSLSSILLMVPEIPLLVLEGALVIAGVPSALTVFEVTFSLRLVGLGLLVGLSTRNRRATGGDEAEFTAPTPGDS